MRLGIDAVARRAERVLCGLAPAAADSGGRRLLLPMPSSPLTHDPFAGPFAARYAAMDLRERGTLIELNRRLLELWALGKNVVLGWTSRPDGAALLVVPHYAIADYAIATATEPPDMSSIGNDRHAFIARLLSGSRYFNERQLGNAARLLSVELVPVALRQPLGDSSDQIELIDALLQRYSVRFAPNRAAALFDIVGFSLLSPFEQMTQLNSLSYSVNSAHSRMLDRGMSINFARSSTGDGFYIWNRDLGVDANTLLYHFMHLVLADNAIARRKAHGRTVPLLRACFHIGGCYEFHQAEGLNPTIHSDIVGSVTIELARMIERAMPGQILVGEFDTPNAAPSFDPAFATPSINSIEFVDLAQRNLAQLNGLVLSGDTIESIKCYLTGRAQPDGSFSVRKLAINDKHGLSRNVFNAKINIYRRTGEPILLGIEDRLLHGDELTVQPATARQPTASPH